MQLIGQLMSDDDTEDIMSMADASGDGEIDYNEFLQMVLSEDPVDESVGTEPTKPLGLLPGLAPDARSLVA